MEELMKDIFEVVTGQKESFSGVTVDLPGIYRTDEGEIVAFLSIGDNYTRAFVSTGKSESLQPALEQAIETYRNNITINFTPVSVKLDLVTKVMPISKNKSRLNIKKDEVTYRRGEDGLLLNEDFTAAFLPEEVEAYNMVDKKYIQRENVFQAFEKHFLLNQSKIIKRFMTSEFMNLYKFRTDSHYIDENGYRPLFRGHRMYDTLSAEDLSDAVQLTKDNYFKQVVNQKGKFVYAFYPDKNTSHKGYNILRHAGTTYSMLETYEFMPDDNLMSAIKRAINYLLSKVEDININGVNANVLVEKDTCKLGGNGLSIVALAKYTQITGDRQHLPVMQNMATWMEQLQDETGKFAIHKQVYSTGKDTGFVSHYYPGEAILSLVRLYQVDKNEHWLDLAENEANYLINIRDKEADLDSIAHDHWLLYALNDLYRERPKEMYLKHAMFISEAIIKTQRLDESAYEREWLGSYESKNTPRSTPAACRVEGLGAAYRMTADHGYEKQAEQYKKSMIESAKFQLQMHLKPESVMYYNYKKFCLGAVHQGLKNYELRNDYTQHNISSFISLHNIIK